MDSLRPGDRSQPQNGMHASVYACGGMAVKVLFHARDDLALNQLCAAVWLN